MIRARKNAAGQLVEILPDGSERPLEGMTDADWARFDAMTDEDAYQNALEDPDNPPLTPERLAKMRRIPNPIRLRESLGLTQEEFAHQFHIALGTVRDWESGVRRPDGMAKTYLRVIEKIPDAVRQALNGDAVELTTTANELGRAKSA